MSDNTIDNWVYRNARPRDKHLGKIVSALLLRTPVDEDIPEDQIPEVEARVAEILTNELRVFYWWSEIVGLLVKYIDQDAALEIARHVRKYAVQARAILECGPESQDYAFAVMDVLFYGSRQSLSEVIIKILETHENDREWREDLKHVSEDWIGRVLPIVLEINNSEVDALIESTNGQLLQRWDVSDPGAYDHYRKSTDLAARGKMSEAVAEVERAADIDQTDPANHFTLGSALSGIVQRTGDAAMIQRGLDECWLAASLDPGWVLPWTEIGFILLNSGRSQEALDHLLSVSENCGPLDSRYYLALGAAQASLGLSKDALASFDEAFELDSENQSLVILAAKAAHNAGDKRKFRKFLRLAGHLGASTESVKQMIELTALDRDYLSECSSDISSGLWTPY